MARDKLSGMLLQGREITGFGVEPWEKHEDEYKKTSDKIKQGAFGHVHLYRVKHTQKQQSTFKVTKEVWPIPGDKHQQHMHELEFFRRLNGHRLREHMIKLLNVFRKVEGKDVIDFILMGSGLCTLHQISAAIAGIT